MESQFRRGILDACVLAVLEKGESYGYQLVKDISAFIEITESTLYPILKRLEQTELFSLVFMHIMNQKNLWVKHLWK